MRKGLTLLLYAFIAMFVVFFIIGGGFGNKPDLFLNNGNVTVFAHKGNSEYEVANSIPAFECSAEIGFTANEIDIRHTSDGKLILFHDDTCNRLLGIDYKIKDVEWNFIKDTKLLFDWRPTTYTAVSLEHFFQFYKPEQLVYMDIKEASKAVADSLLELLKTHKNPKNILIANSNILFINYIKLKNPNIKTVLEGFKKGKEWIYYFIPKNFKPDFYAS
ncbi:MAG: hypothetical protein KDB74_13385, partial [Flavobacteriales bacterium]|nr:hypothetical protein [Flavobacteriales bacterium]